MKVVQVGAGVIGCGWTAYLLAHSIDVAVVDPADGAEARLSAYLDTAAPALEQMGHDLTGWRNHLSFTRSLAPALDGADVVQENGPERAELKAALLVQIDAGTGPDTIVASSSSGMMPSALAAMCPRHPQRVIIGHPFNPVYLIPLVEVVPGPDTPTEIVDRALAFYRGVGKRPVHVRHEVPGHLANRLQAALWREAYSLVERGIATVADIDAAIAHGPGLRWALLGPLVNQHLSGGPGGLAHVLEHLGPPTQTWMDDLGAPQLTPQLATLLVNGVDDELAGIDVQTLTQRRDALLVQLLTAKSATPDLPA